MAASSLTPSPQSSIALVWTPFGVSFMGVSDTAENTRFHAVYPLVSAHECPIGGTCGSSSLGSFFCPVWQCPAGASRPWDPPRALVCAQCVQLSCPVSVSSYWRFQSDLSISVLSVHSCADTRICRFFNLHTPSFTNLGTG